MPMRTIVYDFGALQGNDMDIIVELIKSGLTFGAVVLAIGFVAAFMMLIFSLATGIDKSMSR